MMFFDSELFGKVPSPESIEDLLALVKSHAPNRRNVYFWRGQSDIQWPIHSAAYRRLKITNKEVTEQIMQSYEKSLLEHATHQGYRYDNNRELKDLELLAKLQHHGAATRLLDCSRNLLIGLWFACTSEQEKNGLLFGFHSDFVGGYENELEIRSYTDVCSELEGYDHPFVWQPPVVSTRIASQSAQFLYSGITDKPSGSVAISSNIGSYIAINITPSFKKLAFKELAETFDIRHLTLFPDLDGFGYVHSFRFGQFQHNRW